MGKKTRSKRQRGKQKSNSHTTTTTKSDANHAAADSMPPKGPMILQRIRSADPKTRHAALSALAHTSFDPESLGRKKTTTNGKTTASIDSTVIQAVRDQLMDRDLNCAITAAGCLANYAAFCDNTEQQPLTAGWILLLVGRLNDCLSHIPDLQQQHTDSIPRSTKNQIHWWELAERCLTCLVHLLENNPLAIERMLPLDSAIVRSSPDASLRQNFMSILSEFLSRSVNAAAVASTATSSNSANGAAAVASTTTTADGHEFHVVVRRLCCRCFHSAWDDNSKLFIPWIMEQPEVAKRTLTLLHQLIVQGTSCQDDMAARLHAAGALLSVWASISNEAAIAAFWQQQNQPLPNSILSECIGLLNQGLQWDVEARRAQIILLQAAYDRHQHDQADCDLEREVLSEQERKKEPARLIARRLQNDHNKKEDVSGGVQTMVTEHVDDANMNETAAAPMEDDDGATMVTKDTQPEDWEDAIRHWEESTRPLQLALEIIANLTSASSSQKNTTDVDVDDDDECMTDANDAVDPELIQELLKHHIPGRILDLLQGLISLSSSFGDGVSTDLIDQIKESVSDLQAKVAVCIGHCVSNMASVNPAIGWVMPPNLFQLLQNAWTCAMNDTAQEAVGSALVTVLRLRCDEIANASLIDSVVDFLLKVLQKRVSPVAMRDAICMLGLVLCNRREGRINHSAQLNQKVVTELIEASNCSNDVVCGMIVSETLNVLMDIYGDDECHPAVFEGMHVLDFFQQALPKLKKCISLKLDAGPEDLEQWKETAVNTSRFIQYKKGYLE